MPRSSHFSLSCWARCLKIESDSWRFSLPENYCNWSSCITPNIASEILEKWYPWIKKSWNNEYSCDAVLLTVKTSLKHWIPTWILKQSIILFFYKFLHLLVSFTTYCWNSATLESFIRMTLHNCWQIWCQHRKWILFCQNEFSRQPSQKCERILPLVALVMGMFSTRTFINSSFWPFCWKTPVFVKNFNLVSNFL